MLTFIHEIFRCFQSTRHNDLKTKDEDESLLCTKDKPSIYKLPTQTRLKLSIRKWNVSISSLFVFHTFFS